MQGSGFRVQGPGFRARHAPSRASQNPAEGKISLLLALQMCYASMVRCTNMLILFVVQIRFYYSWYKYASIIRDKNTQSCRRQFCKPGSLPPHSWWICTNKKACKLKNHWLVASRLIARVSKSCQGGGFSLSLSIIRSTNVESFYFSWYKS